MIPSSEVRRISGANHLDPMIIERDYVLGCYLHYLAEDTMVKESWVFKGGTCLRKCFFPDYRFSEDLDFTIQKALILSELKETIKHVNHLIQGEHGIRLDEREPVIELIEDEYGKESFEAKVYYRGPLNFKDSLPALRIHLNRNETIVFPLKILPVSHKYSDQNSLPEIKLKTYALEEMLAEKLRAFSGQRKYAISRDIYDIYKLTDGGLDRQKAMGAFQKKCHVKGIFPQEIDIDMIERRQKEFEINWQNNLEYLIPGSQKVSFEVAWNRAIDLLKRAIRLI